MSSYAKAMAARNSYIMRYLHILLVSYTSLAVLYTTHHFFLDPFLQSLGLWPTHSRYSPNHSQGHSWRSLLFSPFSVHQSLTPPSAQRTSGRTSPLVHWTSPHGDPNVTIPEALFLSKTFSASMQPSTTVPFFYRAAGSSEFTFEEDDVTITTLITADRFLVFKRLVDAYTGAPFRLFLPLLSPHISLTSTVTDTVNYQARYQ